MRGKSGGHVVLKIRWNLKSAVLKCKKKFVTLLKFDLFRFFRIT